MIGELIAKIREDKKISKTDLAKETNINVGHLTHIEKGERNPSHKALKSLCTALDVPYQPLMYTYDKKLTEEQQDYKAQYHVKYDSIPIFSNIAGFAKCPIEYNTASCVIRVANNDMAPKYKEGSFVYIEFNSPLANKDIGIFEYEGKMLLRKFIIRKNDLVLRAEDSSIQDIVVTKDSNFYIVGKVLGIAG